MRIVPAWPRMPRARRYVLRVRPDGRLRVTVQGEMIQANFGLPEIALRTLEIYATILEICERSKKLGAPTYKVADIMVEEKLAAKK